LPFVRPAQVRRAFPEQAAQIKTYADAVKTVIDAIELDPAARNVLVAHQFVVGGDMALSDSEERMVGGVDAVPAEIFRSFDYVALGHLHAPQRAGSEHVRYAGSPLKYSLSEEKQKKAALKVCLGQKQPGSHADLQVESLEYHPLRRVKSLKGALSELTGSNVFDTDYVFVTLTDELPPLDPVGSLLQSYPNYVQLRMENSRTMGGAAETMIENIEDKNPLEHFVDFFFSQNNGAMPTENQMELMRSIVQEAEVKLNASH